MARSIAQRVVGTEKGRGPFNGLHMFVLHTIPHPDGKHQYVVGTIVDRDTGATLKTYYDAIRRNEVAVTDVEKVTSDVRKAASKKGREREEALNDIKYDIVNRHGDLQHDAKFLSGFFDEKTAEAYIIPADFKAQRGTLISKKPPFMWKLQPGDQDYLITQLKKRQERNRQGLLGVTRAIRQAIEKENDDTRA